MKKTISPQYRFSIPSEIDEILYNGKYLIISPTTANWIVLENESQLVFFHLLKEWKLGDALKNFSGSYEDARKTVTQIIAKDFENTNRKSCISNDTKQLHLYITNGCNLKCPHCYMFSGVKSDGELTLQQIEYVIDEFAKNGGTSITLSGGEITMRNDLKQIIDFAYKSKIKIRLLSNGVLWSEKLIKEIAKKIDSVQISVDGYSEESNSLIRGKGNFNKSLQTIQWFIDNKVSTEIAITPPYSSVEKDESNNYIDFCKHLLAVYPQDLFKIKIADQLIYGREVNLKPSQSEEYVKFAMKIRSGINGCNAELESFIDAFNTNTVMDNCMYGIFSIDSKGDVFFCSRTSSLQPICNIKDTHFDKVFEMSKKAQRLSKIDNFRPCSKCSIRYICGGGCRIENFPEFAQITDIDSVDFQLISERKCNSHIKNRFYRLMLESNERLYK